MFCLFFYLCMQLCCSNYSILRSPRSDQAKIDSVHNIIDTVVNITGVNTGTLSLFKQFTVGSPEMTTAGARGSIGMRHCSKGS